MFGYFGWFDLLCLRCVGRLFLKLVFCELCLEDILDDVFRLMGLT